MPGTYCTRSVISCHTAKNSSAAAFFGAFIGWWSMTSGLSSIISLWFCRRAMASLRGIWAGRGVIVVNRTRFPILHVFRLGGGVLLRTVEKRRTLTAVKDWSQVVYCAVRLPPRRLTWGRRSFVSKDYH